MSQTIRVKSCKNQLLIQTKFQADIKRVSSTKETSTRIIYR